MGQSIIKLEYFWRYFTDLKKGNAYWVLALYFMIIFLAFALFKKYMGAETVTLNCILCP